MDQPQPILKTHPHLKDFLNFLDQSNKESDRGKVLIAAAMLDDLLLNIIAAFLVKGKSANKLIEGFNAPLGSFSSRIEAANAMGLIHEAEYNELNGIRKIRNEFAHKIGVSFDDQRLISQCGELKYAADSYDNVTVDSRGQFLTAATALILNLTNRAHYVAKKRLTVEKWPY